MKKSTGNYSANKVPRPKNCFILFRLDMQSKVSKLCPGANHRDISRITAKWWREASVSEHKYYKELAKQEKIQHAKMYPNYKYNPVRKTAATRPYRKRAPHEFTSKDLQKNRILNRLYNEERINADCESSKNPILLNVEHASPKMLYRNVYLSPNDSQLAYSDSLSDSVPNCSPSNHSYGDYIHSPYTVPKDEVSEYQNYNYEKSCSEMKCNYSTDKVIQSQSGGIPSFKQNVHSECPKESIYTASYESSCNTTSHNAPSISDHYNPSQVTHFDYHPGYYTSDPKHLLLPYNYDNYTYTHSATQADIPQLHVNYMNYAYYNQY